MKKPRRPNNSLRAATWRKTRRPTDPDAFWHKSKATKGLNKAQAELAASGNRGGMLNRDLLHAAGWSDALIEAHLKAPDARGYWKTGYVAKIEDDPNVYWALCLERMRRNEAKS